MAGVTPEVSSVQTGTREDVPHGGSGAPPGGGITLGLKDFKGQGSGQREGGALPAEGAARQGHGGLS